MLTNFDTSVTLPQKEMQVWTQQPRSGCGESVGSYRSAAGWCRFWAARLSGPGNDSVIGFYTGRIGLIVVFHRTLRSLRKRPGLAVSQSNKVIGRFSRLDRDC